MHRGEGHVKTETGIGVTLPQSKERRETSEAGRGKEPSLLEPSEEVWPCLYLRLWIPELAENKFLL